jgi:hypothetical protein
MAKKPGPPRATPVKVSVEVAIISEGSTQRSFPASTPKMIRDFIFENAQEPRLRGSVAPVGAQFLVSREKGLLHQIFGSVVCTEPNYCIAKQIVAIVIDPS